MVGLPRDRYSLLLHRTDLVRGLSTGLAKGASRFEQRMGLGAWAPNQYALSQSEKYRDFQLVYLIDKGKQRATYVSQSYIDKGKQRATSDAFMDLTIDDDDEPPIYFKNLASSSAGEEEEGGFSRMQIQKEEMKKVCEYLCADSSLKC
jgi:hypothetical protein